MNTLTCSWHAPANDVLRNDYMKKIKVSSSLHGGHWHYSRRTSPRHKDYV